MNFNEHFFVHHDKHLVFFPINKNASTTFIQFFKKKSEWEHTNQMTNDLYSYHMFAHIQNPKLRYIKGIAELLDTTKSVSMLTSSPGNLLALRLYHDKHLISISDMFGDLVETINFIPIEGNSSVVIYDFLRVFDIDYPELLNHRNSNVSNERKKEIHRKIDNLLMTVRGKAIYQDKVAGAYRHDHALWLKAHKNVGMWPYVSTYQQKLDARTNLEKELNAFRIDQSAKYPPTVWEKLRDIFS